MENQILKEETLINSNSHDPKLIAPKKHTLQGSRYVLEEEDEETVSVSRVLT